MRRKFRAFDDPELKAWLLDLIADPSASFLGALPEAVLMATPEDYCVVRRFLVRFKEKYRRVPRKARIHR